ncbi:MULTISPECIES: aminodeoxychorismate synthase component I [Alphaproteobacteria]|uniref:Aminodeoxychorismate synthase component I n=2 Tax=Alphaproteobacteria TaxID=28211 RepID=A0A512HKW4_9HYPH|nr:MULTISPECIES: aminodeoxychorismate synthase component I [Alphaproteobacteria]GEO86083.1 aminodeoxychorismate synthase component I [Ciceribacter naphthalenivorans]GLR22170.1 aminodeoxychorismate synthase component I [Ciceribacter naphthalenivorans]GLT05026.1 aminodeoxychorismate synthase component I [Sphingomonas psychrolutea]
MADHPPHVLFRDDKRGESLLFADPREIIIARTADEVLPAFERLEAARWQGRWLAGHVSYEAGYVFEEKLRSRIVEGRETPLLAIGIFDAPESAGHPLAAPPAEASSGSFLTDPQAAWDFDTYREKFQRLHDHLRKGDCYQANLTMPIEARWRGDPRSAFWSLVARQPVHYGALIDLGGPVILSRSPELFFKVDEQGWIETHPMKGTAARGASPAEDEAIIAAMLADEKTLAENRMIVDLLRNDVSAISEVATLSVPKLFEIETYPTVHQMVSHVRAKLVKGIGLPDIFRALFPCGSVTGAPKMWAMRILAELEAGPRDVYCGAIGFCDPAGPMRFSVAIRTLTLFKHGRAVFNVGGGIVFDSKAEAEYEECLLKARFAVGDQWISR